VKGEEKGGSSWPTDTQKNVCRDVVRTHVTTQHNTTQHNTTQHNTMTLQLSCQSTPIRRDKALGCVSMTLPGCHAEQVEWSYFCCCPAGPASCAKTCTATSTPITSPCGETGGFSPSLGLFHVDGCRVQRGSGQCAAGCCRVQQQ
jgi:hypothetical protein